MIQVSHLSKDYGAITAIDDLTFTIAQGEIVALLGANGAGKSTTLRILTTALTPSRGDVTIHGHRLSDAPLAIRQHIGYLPEHNPLYHEMLVLDALLHAASLRGLSRRKARDAAYAVATRCAISDRLHQKIATLSKGYRQRVGLAQALIHRPPILILDEPSSGLDPNQRHEILSLIRSLSAESTILLSTHLLPEAESLCHRALILHQGRLVADTSHHPTTTTLRLSFAAPSPPDLEARLQRYLREHHPTAALKPLPASSAHAGEGPSFMLTFPTSADPRPDLLNWAIAEALPLLELHRTESPLAALFSQLTRGAHS